MPATHFTVSQIRAAAACPRILYFDAADARARGLKQPAVTRIWKTAQEGEGAACGTLFHAAIERFNGPDYIYPGYSYAPWTELARLLASLAPRPLTTCFRATGGSEAVDLALQAAMIHTGRRALLSLEGSYHGNSIATLSIGLRQP